MSINQRLALILTASAFAFGTAAVPAAQAADSMMKSSGHKNMKKHKGDAMKGDAMKSDATKGDAPAQ